MTLRNKKVAAIALGLPCVYAIAVRFLFGVDKWQHFFTVMTLTFVFLLPFIMGALTLYFSSAENRKRRAYRIFAPWVPVFIFLALTIAFAWEGWGCWLMVLPVFLIGSSIGGVLGERLRRWEGGQNLHVSLLILLPVFASPIEQLIGFLPADYEAYTYIDIDAPAETIWKNVTRVREIAVNEDQGWLTRLLGLPRPVKAELDFEGVGATREAIFTKGLIFHETVSEYVEGRKMVFSIKAYPHEISPLAMDEHVVIGGKYFDVLNGVYLLEKRGNNKHRLHLYSHFKLSTNFNFYAGYWATWIMKDIQNNILQVEKQRSEGGNR